MTLTHAQLVDAARRWLRDTQRCSVVLTETVNGSGETPDAIGWHGSHTIVVEAKVSRADFRADAGKPFRRLPDGGMGDYRFFITTPGLILPSELPAGWGLLVVNGRGVSTVVRSHHDECWCLGGDPLSPRGHRERVTACRQRDEKNSRSEALLLLSLVRRLKGVGVRGKATADIREYTLDEHGEEVGRPAGRRRHDAS